MHQSNANPRRALVRLRNGRDYECIAYIEQGFVHGEAVRRRVSLGDVTVYRDLSDRTWPPRELREIRWADSEAAR